MVQTTPTGLGRRGYTLSFLPAAVACRQRAFTLFELLIVVAIIGVVAAVAWPSYQHYLNQARIAQAKAEIRIIESKLERYYAEQLRYPETLAHVGLGDMRDPWGNPYRYLRITPTTTPGKLRKDRNLVPINSDYDLYSMGKNGVSVSPLTAAPSRDDVIRASNGRFVGLASDY